MQGNSLSPLYAGHKESVGRQFPSPLSTRKVHSAVSGVSEAALSLALNERVIRNTTAPAVVPTEQPDEVRLLFWSHPQCHSQTRFLSGCGAPSGQHVAVTQARCCWPWPCMTSIQRSFAVVYQPRHYLTNGMHITR